MCWNRVAAVTSASRLIGCALYKQMHCCRCHDVQLAGFWSRMSHQAHFTRNCGAARSGFLCLRCLQQRRQRISGPKQRKPTHFIRCTPDHFCSKLLGGSRSVVDSFAFIATLAHRCGHQIAPNTHGVALVHHHRACKGVCDFIGIAALTLVSVNMPLLLLGG
jgi:hypothetical protein